MTKQEEVIAKFDFEKVHKVMELLNWKYFDSPSVPTIERLKEMAREHLDAVVSGECSRSLSGGFEAYRSTDECVVHIGLRFIVTGSEVYL